MGKYTNQASSYKMGMGMLNASLTSVIPLIEQAKTLVSSGDNNDALNYYVNSFNNEITKTINAIILKSVSQPVSIMEKARSIDQRIELEQERKRQQEEMEELEKE